VVEDIFQTDPISALGLPSPVSIGRAATVGAALAAVQRHGMGYVLVVDEQQRPVGIMSEREVLMRIVARDVKYDEGVDTYMSHDPETLTSRDQIARAIHMMNEGDERNIPIVDDARPRRRRAEDGGHHPLPGGGLPGAGIEPAAAATSVDRAGGRDH
jgi:CBS domain-containing protein